jgi:hypothetical protein
MNWRGGKNPNDGDDGNDGGKKKRKGNTGVVVTQEQESPLLMFPAEVLRNIASTLTAFEFERYTAEDYLNFALTCKYISGALIVNFPKELQHIHNPLNTARRVERVLSCPLTTSIVTDTFNNVSWRVCFETDLCVLVFFRHGIVGKGVQFVASCVADKLALLLSGQKKAIQAVIQQRMRGCDDRYFGKLRSDLTVDDLIAGLRAGKFRIEEMMYIFQCLGFFCRQALALKEDVYWLVDNKSNWEIERKNQLKSNNKDPVPTQGLGISTDNDLYSFKALMPHSSALGRRDKVPSARGMGFGKMQDDQGLPFVGGPSGSSLAMLSVAVEIAKLDKQDPELQRQFLLATVAFLVGGGQHGFAELMHGMPNIVDALGYKVGKYTDLLPLSLTTRPEWQRILKKYLRYLKDL